MKNPLRKLGGVSDLNIEQQENGIAYKGFKIYAYPECNAYVIVDDRGVKGFGHSFSSIGEAKNTIDQLVIDNSQFGVGA